MIHQTTQKYTFDIATLPSTFCNGQASILFCKGNHVVVVAEDGNWRSYRWMLGWMTMTGGGAIDSALTAMANIAPLDQWILQ